ncbi:hypothetical protein ISF12_10400 [Pseudomonas aeruginosa]|nr:hypothetical protein [Pseudomonas aeruginosa]
MNDSLYAVAPAPIHPDLEHFISNPFTSTKSAYIKVSAVISRLEKEANDGCGQFYELYESRLIGSLRSVADKLTPKDREVFERGALAMGLKFDDEALSAAQVACAEIAHEMRLFQGLDEDEDYEAIALYEDMPELERKFGFLESAAREGWAITECPDSEHGRWQVQKIDSPEEYSNAHGYPIPKLETDEQAWLIVLGGDRIHHESARNFIEVHNPALWQQMEQYRENLLQPLQRSRFPGL